MRWLNLLILASSRGNTIFLELHKNVLQHTRFNICVISREFLKTCQRQIHDVGNMKRTLVVVHHLTTRMATTRSRTNTLRVCQKFALPDISFNRQKTWIYNEPSQHDQEQSLCLERIQKISLALSNVEFSRHKKGIYGNVLVTTTNHLTRNYALSLPCWHFKKIQSELVVTALNFAFGWPKFQTVPAQRCK